jgi:hypothetical protein
MNFKRNSRGIQTLDFILSISFYRSTNQYRSLAMLIVLQPWMFLNHVCIKTLSSAVFRFSFSARTSTRIFQKEMSDARDTFWAHDYACFWHVHFNGALRSIWVGNYRGQWRKEMHPYFWLPVLKTFGCFCVFRVYSTYSFFFLFLIFATIRYSQNASPKKGKLL